MEKIDIRISDDRLQAYMTITSFDGLTLQNIIEHIQDNGIVYGVLIPEIQNVFENKVENKETLIAQGKKPVDGKDGKCISYVNKNISSHTYEIEGNSINIPICNVSKRQKLLKIEPHTPGIRGVSVDGGAIVARNGKPVKLVKIKNAEFSRYNLNYLLSKIDGNLSWDGNEINVSPNYKILGNVTSSNGPIDFIGDLIIIGNVSSGVEITTIGNLEVHGDVKDAKLTSLGNVTIKGKCYGSGKGIIFARGDVTVFEAEHYTLKSLKNILIKNNCSDSVVEAFSIIAPNASIFEVSLSAFELVELKEIGYKVNTLTKISIGNKLYKMRFIKELEKNVVDCKNLLSELNETYNKILSKKMRTGSANQEEEMDMLLLKENINELIIKKENLLLWRKLLVKKLGNTQDSKLLVNGSLYPNVTFYINDLRYENSRILTNSVFIEQNNEIIRLTK